MKRIGIALLLGVNATVASTAQLDQAFQTRHDFTIYLPAGWVEVPNGKQGPHPWKTTATRNRVRRDFRVRAPRPTVTYSNM